MPKLTAESLFDYAEKYARQSETKGLGTQYPTVREAARHFRVRQSDIEDTAQDWQDKGYMGLIVGIRSGSGIGGFDRLGDYMVEAEKEDV